MRTAYVGITVLLAVAWAATGVFAQDGAAKAATFDSAEAIAGWTTSGDVSVDASKNREGEGGGALKVGPGGKAVWTLRDTDGSGKVDLWIFEDQTKPADPKARRVGPRWGLVQKDGRVLVMGVIYAPYLGGGTAYATSDSDQKSWFNVQHSAVKRTAGWHRWTFDFDAAKGLAIAHNGKALPKRRFDWNKTKIKGFTGVALFGDGGKGDGQTIWVDDVAADLGGPVQAMAAPPPPPPPATPETDPAPENPVSLVPAVEGKHPRLLFTAEDIPAMREKVTQGRGKQFYDAMLKYLPVCKAPEKPGFLRDATDGQRQGFWRLPTVALHYVLTGDKQSFDRTVEFMKFLQGLDNWETGQERDSGMSAANVMVGAALAYDWLYNDLDPAFRAQYRDKLLLMARRMYHQGHLNSIKSTGYWQSDPQNNHRFHRNAGLVLCALAAAEAGKTDDDWILAKTREEMDFITRWLPPDGTCHESPSYMAFGNTHLMLAVDAADRCLGTAYLQHSFFKSAAMFRFQSMAPGLTQIFPYGDCGSGPGSYNNYVLRATAVHKLKDEQAALFKAYDASQKFLEFAWFSAIWYDPSADGGSVDNLPAAAFYPDLGIATIRDGWNADNVGAMLKCGPYGGFKLNEYRNTNNFHYVNVAHDDPDANIFLIYARGQMLATDDGYSKKKVTSSHNTILVNGKGQKQEGGGWTQPIKRGDMDMTHLAWPVTFKTAGNVTVAEGEAAGTYPDLSRYRRTLIWKKGAYVLVLDDIRAPKPAEITWLVQGTQLEPVGSEGRFRLKKEGEVMEFQLVADKPYAAQVVTSTADMRGKSMDLMQLQAKATADRWRTAAVFDPWNHKGLTVSLAPDGDDAATVTVKGPGISDTWTWRLSPDGKTPSTLKGPGIEVGPADKAPTE